MSDRVEIKGKTVDEAVAEALLQMGARQDEVEVTVLEEPKTGFMGLLGNRQARVLVRFKPGKGRRSGNHLGVDEGYEAHDLSNRPSGRSRQRNTSSRNRTRPTRSQSRERDQKEKAGSRNPAPRDNRAPGNNKAAGETSGAREEKTPPNGSTRRRRGRRGKPQTERAPQSSSINVAPTEPPMADSKDQASRSEKPKQGGGSPRNDRNDRPVPDGAKPAATEEARIPQRTPVEPDKIIKAGIQSTNYAKPIRGIAAEQIDSTLSELTEGMLVRAGFTCRCEVQQGEYSRVKLVTDDASAGMLIGRHGAAIDAVEHLIERMAGMAAGERVKMNLDINNYRRRREEILISRAKDIFHQVKESGREFHLEPMSARERRIVHLEAAENKGFKTYTVAGTQGKHVVIALDDGGAKDQPEMSENNIDTELPGSEEQPQG